MMWYTVNTLQLRISKDALLLKHRCNVQPQDKSRELPWGSRQRASEQGAVSKQQIVMFIEIILILCVLSLMELSHRKEEIRGDRTGRQKGVLKCFNVMTNSGVTAIYRQVFLCRCINILYFLMHTQGVLATFVRLSALSVFCDPNSKLNVCVWKPFVVRRFLDGGKSFLRLKTESFCCFCLSHQCVLLTKKSLLPADLIEIS